ncbi:MAG: hydrogenase formation protein HypD, partial [Candidatus Cloacimonadota bacterium]|nr:hydrogenase formation protein HypD [Candidatus Cloacimonadota bacterium]
DIKIIYSPLEALELAKKNETVLAGIGFETTIPGIAQTIMLAKKQNITNFSVLPAFKTVPMALRVLMNDKDVKLDGFLLPGHVSIITGLDMYNFITEEYKKSGVVAGFEPYDVLHAIKSLMLMKKNKNPQITNEYTRVVKNSGNIIAQKIIDEVLEPIDVIWRGLGTIPNSGLSIRKKFEDFDASKKYNIDLTKEGEEITGCQCGDVLKGKIIPPSCKLFGEVCNPSNPIGPCMVSSEGSCAAYYKYEDYEK